MKKEWTMESASVMPVIALRGLTVFPNVLIHFDVAREISIKALEEAMSSGSPVFLVGQKDISEERPEEKDLYTVGTISNVRQILRTPGDNVRVMVEGVSRGSLERLTRTGPYLEAEVQPIPSEQHERNSAKAEALIRSTYELFQQYTELAPKTAPDLLINVLASEDPGYIADFIAQNIAMRNSDKQAVLEELRPVRRLERLHRLLGREVEILGLDMEIQNRAREQMADNQRDYYLREQMKAIQNELGEGEGGDSEIGDYRRKIAEAKLPDEVREKLEKEVGRLAKQPFGSSEATVLRSYLDVCLELPWGKKTRERVSVEAARRTLDKDHFGLEKVKERILEFLAVKQLAPDLKGQVICLVGPPGVGKTSVAMSVARALNRKLARLSLGPSGSGGALLALGALHTLHSLHSLRPLRPVELAALRAAQDLARRRGCRVRCFERFVGGLPQLARRRIGGRLAVDRAVFRDHPGSCHGGGRNHFSAAVAADERHTKRARAVDCLPGHDDAARIRAQRDRRARAVEHDGLAEPPPLFRERELHGVGPDVLRDELAARYCIDGPSVDADLVAHGHSPVHPRSMSSANLSVEYVRPSLATEKYASSVYPGTAHSLDSSTVAMAALPLVAHFARYRPRPSGRVATSHASHESSCTSSPWSYIRASISAPPLSPWASLTAAWPRSGFDMSSSIVCLFMRPPRL